VTTTATENIRKAIARVRQCQVKEDGGGNAPWSDTATELAEAIEAWALETDPVARRVLDLTGSAIMTGSAIVHELADRVALLREATSSR